ADICLNGFGPAETIEATRRQIEQEAGVRCLYHPADMAQPAEIGAMVEAATAAFGAVDILVNNAGIQHTAAIEDFPAERWDAIIAVNLSAAFHGIRAVLPGMRRRGWGRIVNTASAHGLVASVHK